MNTCAHVINMQHAVSTLLGTVCMFHSCLLRVVEVYLEHHVRYDRAKILPACTTVSAIWLRPTVLIHNMVSVMYFEA